MWKIRIAAVLLAAAGLTHFVVGTDIRSANAQQVDVAELLEEVAGAADRLKTALDELPDRIEEAKNSEQTGLKLLDQLEDVINDIASKLEENGAIWQQLSELQEIWKQNYKRALDKSQSDSQYREIADLWKEKLDKVAELKQTILIQRGESLSLMDSMSSRRGKIVEYYKLGAADRVVAAMQEISDQFAEMNEGMRQIVEATAGVVGPVTQ